MEEVNVRIEVEVNPTESEDKVKRAVHNLFGGLSIKVKPLDEGGILVAKGRGLEVLANLHDLLRREQIRTAARGILFGGLNGKVISFWLNKQAAYAGHVSFSTQMSESPLGPIKVRIECDNPRKVINWLTPKKV